VITMRKKGMTLIEVLLATAILATVLGGLYGTYLSGLKVWEDARERADLQAQARLAMDVMVNELRNATRTSTQNPSPNLSIPSSPNNKQIQFYLPADKDGDGLITDNQGDIEWATNNMIHYQFVPGQKKLRRLEQGVERILANDVSDVAFSDIGIDPTLALTELKIVLTLSKTTTKGRNVTFTLTSLVRLRN